MNKFESIGEILSHYDLKKRMAERLKGMAKKQIIAWVSK
jgi:hypothetical protein